MSLAKTAARLVLHQMGGLSLVRALHRSGVRILMYHRFHAAAPDTLTGMLDRQAAALQRHYTILPLGEVADILDRRKPLPANALVLTVDDGYRDVYDVAYPVWSARRIPATIFLVTGFLDRRLWLWTDHVLYLCEKTALPGLDFAAGTVRLALQFSTPGQRRGSARKVIETVKDLPNQTRIRTLEALAQGLGVALPEQVPDTDLEPLRWDDVRTMARNGIEFGAHTDTHPILSQLEDPAEVRHEMAHSKQRIEQELGSPAIHFCYPNGRPQDYTPATVACIEELGFRTAVTTIPGINTVSEPRFLLKRFGMEPESPLEYALERTEGLHDRA